ncbi:stalk domain-containing protein [Paenibacillus pasadenensis]|uniref:stalk domain-containing protein n=1 Tax=Paenibacillus pasadenensis TaxID=217090 RepID=UPI0020424BB6|nr:stalk domain-containing protein [Paenibacillus pasadenensis]MCM3746264.1 stalk domain-containing protein [Paenibacillus pasadenensis]
MQGFKKMAVAISAAAFIATGIGGAAASAAPAKETAISVYLNGKKQAYDQPPVIVNGSTLVPLRGIFEGLGAKISLNGKTITATKGFTTIQHTIGQNWAVVDGETVPLSQSSLVLKGRTLVPLRFIGEALDSKVSWNSAKKQVTVAALTGAELQTRWADKADAFVWAGKLDKLQQMLKLGWKPALSEQAWMNSVFTKNKEMVKLFLDNGANVNLLVEMENESSLALLEVATLPYRETAEGDYYDTTEQADLELLGLLLAAKPNLALLEQQNGSLLWTAVTSNRLLLAEELIKAGATVKSDGQKKFKAPLVGAAGYVDENGNRAIPMMELLLKNGADANDCNCDTSEEYTPLEYASSVIYASEDDSAEFQPDIRAVQLLLQYGADPKLDHSLFEAVAAESLDIVKLLLEKGADPNKHYPIADQTPLGLARQIDNKELIALLEGKTA